MISNILILDTETTDKIPGSACLEVACTLYSVKYAAPIESYATIFKSNENPAEAINHLSVDFLKECGRSNALDGCWAVVKDLIELSDIIIAHQASFDKHFVPNEIGSLRPWVCSKHDLEWPLGRGGDDLLHLALAHNVGVVYAHRAMSDVDTLVRLFQRVQNDFKDWDIQLALKKAQRQKVFCEALVSYNEKDKAKESKFRWEPDRKRWVKVMFDEDRAALTFKTKVLNEPFPEL